MAGITKAERNRRLPEQQAVKHTAYRNPNTRCCNCDRPLHQCGPRADGRNANGTPCTWDAGHPDGRWPGTAMRPECSHCNRSRGATMGNRMREPHTPW